MNRPTIAVLLASLASALSACATSPPPPPREAPASTTRTTSAALVTEREPPPAPQTVATERRGPLVETTQPSAKVDPVERRISDRLRRDLMSDRTLRSVPLDRVRITTSGRKVTLEGLVPSLADSVTIETLAREIRGVEAVDNRLQIIR